MPWPEFNSVQHFLCVILSCKTRMFKDFIFLVLTLLLGGTVFLPEVDASTVLGSKLTLSDFQWARSMLIYITGVFVFICFHACSAKLYLSNWYEELDVNLSAIKRSNVSLICICIILYNAKIKITEISFIYLDKVKIANQINWMI